MCVGALPSQRNSCWTQRMLLSYEFFLLFAAVVAPLLRYDMSLLLEQAAYWSAKTGDYASARYED